MDSDQGLWTKARKRLFFLWMQKKKTVSVANGICIPIFQTFLKQNFSSFFFHHRERTSKKPHLRPNDLKTTGKTSEYLK